MKPLGAQISHMLRARGVDTIFGIPGVHNQEMYRGIEEAGITHVLARHEQGAGFMADGYARATGKPGVAYVITGPGLCNIMTPMGQAYSDSVPMLVISSCLDEVASTRGQLHQMRDQEGAAGCVCDWSQTATTAQAAYRLIDRALMEFETQRPRPKHIQVPIKLLEALAEDPPAALARPKTSPIFAPSDMAPVIDALKTAHKPLFIVGGGVKYASNMWRILRNTGAVVMTTYAGRGVVDGTDERVIGSWLARPDSADVIAQADLVIAVGTELADVDLWRDHLGHDAPLVRIDIDAEVLSDAMRAEIPVLADASDALGHIFNETEGWDKPCHWDRNKIAVQNELWRAETDAERPGILPICEALREAAPKNTMFYSDMTQFAYVAKEVIPMSEPGHWHHPYGFGTLGYAMPAAVGGAMARSGKPTIAIAGDYGFQYTLQELGAAVEMDLPLPIILWDNGKLKEIEDSMVRAQIAPNSVIAHNPDFCKLAEAYGAYAAAPTTICAFQDAVTTALAADKPTLIYVTPHLT
ncbi:thiamine pyrophosphate-binding protein [Thalassobium sp. R2A62]|uniref:thiamine pyrophosphate-binding protein n=1 Tax=Thalassobium sp. R2A62 TaxID=633131 RepID=UPI0001B1D765|nr:thiamine pyrophosphate-binding protein [Thalassobium sp. R2A62]EET49332.1 thiamine pyrophosphate protein TPP binding domain protein [Thalassobium sp. R2A62]MDG1341212.1 thiamine pyrophosphate-binding protein [Paracoccaceae bacterium]MDG2452925.1 thiamine pyrophosphate-binding protein [Paracoccaceae bacterium]